MSVEHDELASQCCAQFLDSTVEHRGVPSRRRSDGRGHELPRCRVIDR